MSEHVLQRKVTRAGVSSLALVLPKFWAEAQHPQAGSRILAIIDGSSVLRVKPREEATD